MVGLGGQLHLRSARLHQPLRYEVYGVAPSNISEMKWCPRLQRCQSHHFISSTSYIYNVSGAKQTVHLVTKWLV
jgi:hypothetical protein